MAYLLNPAGLFSKTHCILICLSTVCLHPLEDKLHEDRYYVLFIAVYPAFGTVLQSLNSCHRNLLNRYESWWTDRLKGQIIPDS